MLEFIKMFGVGVLYTLLSPFIAALFALFLVYALVNYLVCEIINLSGYFMGKRFTAETKLEKDFEKKKKLEEAGVSVEVEAEESIVEDGDFNV